MRKFEVTYQFIGYLIGWLTGAFLATSIVLTAVGYADWGLGVFWGVVITLILAVVLWWD